MKLSVTLTLLALAALVTADNSPPKPKEVVKKETPTTGQPTDSQGYYEDPDADGSYGEPPTDNSDYYLTGDVSEVPLEYHESESEHHGDDYYPEEEPKAGDKAVAKQEPEHKDHPYPYHYPKHNYPEPVYTPPKEEPKKVEPKKEEPNIKKPEMDYEAKQKIYKADPYSYYDHDWLKPQHPKYWVKVSDYEPPKTKDPLNKWEKDNLKASFSCRIRILLLSKTLVSGTCIKLYHTP